MHTPNDRVRPANQRPISDRGDFVLYWMTAARRTRWNHGLDRATEVARELGKPLLVLEPLRADYPWRSARFSRFVTEGMASNRERFEGAGVTYFPYIEEVAGAGRGLLATLGRNAAVVVTDDFPAFFYPKMLEAASRAVPVRLEAVDSNGLLPIRGADKVFTAAHHFRRYLHAVLPDHLDAFPDPDPLDHHRLPGRAVIPEAVRKRWPAATLNANDWDVAAGAAPTVADASVPIGGEATAREVLEAFLERRLPQYGDRRNQPDADGTSGLSPYLHFGHIAPHEVMTAVLDQEEWTPHRIEPAARGRREGWWGASAAAEAFLDELVTWREVGFNAAVRQPNYDRYDSLPDWALRTLADHEDDVRAYRYDLEQFESAETHDPLWNAAQRQLVSEGRIHGYLRMLWGKKILEWSSSPRDALQVMVELNNAYALDGRDPNSYSGIFWVLGRYDRAWGPERPIFGKVRYMTSANTARKVPVSGYLEKYGRWA